MDLIHLSHFWFPFSERSLISSKLMSDSRQGKQDFRCLWGTKLEQYLVTHISKRKRQVLSYKIQLKQLHNALLPKIIPALKMSVFFFQCLIRAISL